MGLGPRYWPSAPQLQLGGPSQRNGLAARAAPSPEQQYCLPNPRSHSDARLEGHAVSRLLHVPGPETLPSLVPGPLSPCCPVPFRSKPARLSAPLPSCPIPASTPSSVCSLFFRHERSSPDVLDGPEPVALPNQACPTRPPPSRKSGESGAWPAKFTALPVDYLLLVLLHPAVWPSFSPRFIPAAA